MRPAVSKNMLSQKSTGLFFSCQPGPTHIIAWMTGHQSPKRCIIMKFFSQLFWSAFSVSLWGLIENECKNVCIKGRACDGMSVWVCFHLFVVLKLAGGIIAVPTVNRLLWAPLLAKWLKLTKEGNNDSGLNKSQSIAQYKYNTHTYYSTTEKKM